MSVLSQVSLAIVVPIQTLNCRCRPHAVRRLASRTYRAAREHTRVGRARDRTGPTRLRGTPAAVAGTIPRHTPRNPAVRTRSRRRERPRTSHADTPVIAY